MVLAVPAAVVPTVEAGKNVSGGKLAGGIDIFGGEGSAVEGSYEVLSAAAAGAVSGVVVPPEAPLDVVWVSVDGEGEQIRAFPLPSGRICRTEVSQVVPLLQVVALIEEDAVFVGFNGCHDPVVRTGGGVVPEDFGVSEAGGVPVQDRVVAVLGPGLSVVGAERQ